MQPFPGLGDPKPVSTGGGSKPRWNTNGRELFYLGADGRLMSVSVRLPSAGQPIAIGTPVSLFPTKAGTRGVRVSSDGQKFLMVAVHGTAGLANQTDPNSR